MEVQLTERQKEVLRLRESGLTLREIGEMWGVSGSAVSQLLRKIESKKIRAKLREREKQWWQETVILELTLGQIYIIHEGLDILIDTMSEESVENIRKVSTLREMLYGQLVGSSLVPETVRERVGEQLTPAENFAISEARCGTSINQVAKRIGLIHHKAAKLYYGARRKEWAAERTILDSKEAQTSVNVQMRREQIDIVVGTLSQLDWWRRDMDHQKSKYWEQVDRYDPIRKGAVDLYRELFKYRNSK